MSNPIVIHSKLGFSGRERWANCPASVAMSEGVIDEAGPAAREGTAAHGVAEFYMRQFFDLPGALPGECPDVPVPDGVELGDQTPAEWNAQLRYHANQYVHFVYSLIPEGIEPFRNGVVHTKPVAYVTVEQRVSIASIDEQLFGTGDCFVWIPSLKLMIVVDYKYGFGAVEIGDDAYTNPQIAAYAVASLDRKSVHAEAYRLAVYQPRRPIGAPGQVLDVSGDWEQRERAKLTSEAAAVRAGNKPPSPGKHCRYCKGKSKCPTTHNALQTALQAHSGLADLSGLPENEVVALWAAKTAFKAFWEDIEARVEAMARNQSPLVRVKETQGRQMWADEKTATLTLLAMNRPDLLKPGRVSDALEHLPPDFRAALVKRSNPSRSIVPADDHNPAQIQQMFAKYAKKG